MSPHSAYTPCHRYKVWPPLTCSCGYLCAGMSEGREGLGLGLPSLLEGLGTRLGPDRRAGSGRGSDLLQERPGKPPHHTACTDQIQLRERRLRQHLCVWKMMYTSTIYMIIFKMIQNNHI